MTVKARSADGYRILTLKLVILDGRTLIRITDGHYYVGDIAVSGDYERMGRELTRYIDIETIEGINFLIEERNEDG